MSIVSDVWTIQTVFVCGINALFWKVCLLFSFLNGWLLYSVFIHSHNRSGAARYCHAYQTHLYQEHDTRPDSLIKNFYISHWNVDNIPQNLLYVLLLKYIFAGWIKGILFEIYCHCFSVNNSKVYLSNLTLKWPRYFYSRWCPRGVSWNPLRKTTFPPEFCNEICTMYVRAINITILQKKFLNVVSFENGGQIIDFYFSSFRFWPNFEKPLSQRNFSMKLGSTKENMNRFTLLK